MKPFVIPAVLVGLLGVWGANELGSRDASSSFNSPPVNALDDPHLPTTVALQVTSTSVGERAASRGLGRPVLITPTYRQTVTYGPRYEDAPQADRFTIKTFEKDPITQEWYRSWVEHSASFQIERVATRIANEFYLAGVARNGDAVIERWVAEPQNGALAPTRPPASTRIGTPFLSPPLSVPIQGGGGFIAPPQRQGGSIMEKTELYRGIDLGQIRDISVDPDGRFLLALTSELGLVQFDLHDSSPSGPAYASILSLQQVPELAQVRSLYPAEHATAGRTYRMDHMFVEGLLPKDIVLLDAGNDGAFESHFVLSPDEYEAMFPPGSSTDFFLRYE